MHEKDGRGVTVVHCVVIARNGYGDAWRFFDLKAARLHPLPQMDDVYATNGDQLVEQYGRGLIHDLLRFAEGRERARLIDAFEIWKNGGVLPVEARELIWAKVYGAAATPPDDPAELIRLIKEDRSFREGRVLRSTSTEERSSATTETKHARKETMAEARKRIDENSTITVNTEGGANPKRVGSKAFERFALYRDGMTVKEAKAAGVQATDIAYDSHPDHNFILLTPGEVTEAEEEAPKSRKSRAAA